MTNPIPKALLADVRVRRSGLCVLGGIVLSAVYLLVAPSWYSSSLTVVPTKQSRGLGGAGDLLGLDPSSLGMGSNDVDRIAAAFESNTVTDSVIHRLNLSSRYRENRIERLRKELWSHCSLRVVTRGALVTISCEDKDPAVAQQLAESIGEGGLVAFHRVNGSLEREEVSFLEQRVVSARKDADEAARQVRAFEERHSIVDLEAQSKAVVSALAAIQGQRISKELELRYLKKFSSRDEATSVQLRNQIAAMDQESGELFSAQGRPQVSPQEPRSSPQPTEVKSGTSRDLFPASSMVPKLKYEYGELEREKRLRDAALVVLQQRLELAHADVIREGSAFQILDPAVLAMMPSRPQRGISLVVGALLGLLAAAAWAFGPAYLRSLLADEV